MVRIIAFSLLLIPGIISAYGIKLMRDTLFADYTPIFINNGIQFSIGLVFFLGGIAFIGGFVVHRDRKKQQEKNNS